MQLNSLKYLLHNNNYITPLTLGGTAGGILPLTE